MNSKRLTHWNYKNTTLALESCKPYLKLGEIEDLEDKYNVDVNEELFKKAIAFDVIKEKQVDVWLLQQCDYENYVRIRKEAKMEDELTEEEYNLLKMTLENDKE